MRWLASVAIATLVTVSISGSGLPQTQSKYVGTWTATKPTGGISAARISDENGRLSVHLWAACDPADCDWGTKAFIQLPDVETGLPDRGFATWPGSYMTFRLEASELVIEQYRVPMGDNAGPPPYFSIVHYVRGT